MNKRFDKAAFSSLLKKALGTRTQKDFAAEIGLSKEHLSRLINQKLDNPPSMETIQAISRHTTTVSYEELLQAAGYIGDVSAGKVYTLPDLDETDKKLLTATILAALPQLPISWSVEKTSPGSGRDLSIKLKDCPVSAWHFHCMNHTTDTVMNTQLEANYLKLIFEELKPTEKYSLVTASVSEYDKYLSRVPRNLSVNLSVILIDTVSMKVLQETLLQSNGQIKQDALKLCSF